MTGVSSNSWIKELASTSPGELHGTDKLCHALGFDALGTQPDNDKAMSASRNLLEALPLDVRAFNNIYAPLTGAGKKKLHEDAFQYLISHLQRWLRYYHANQPTLERHQALYGFLGIMLMTLEALAESDRIRNAVRPAGVGVPHKSAHDCRKICQRLVREPAVQLFIKRLYRAPSVYSMRTDSTETGGKPDWDELNFGSLAFHRHGTTSIILRVKNESQELLALKLILFPFLRFTEISRDTSEYGLYNPLTLPIQPYDSAKLTAQKPNNGDHAEDKEISPKIVQVIASSERWILMEFIDGITLAELMSHRDLIEAKLDTMSQYGTGNQSFSQLLRHRIESKAETCESAAADRIDIERARKGLLTLDELLDVDNRLNGDASSKADSGAAEGAHSKVAWRWMLALGSALFDAMNDLPIALTAKASRLPHDERSKMELVHGDLTPSNIIVNNSTDLSVTLIDLGRNYFYTQSITGHGSADSTFVAPEIREDAKPHELSDVYSVGQLLQYIGYRGSVPQKMVFDGFYDRTALVARFLEDLIQEVPADRLLIYPSGQRIKDAPRMASEVNWRGVNYLELKRIHRVEVEAVMAADSDGHGLADDSFWEVLNDLLHPWSRAWNRQKTLWGLRKSQQADAGASAALNWRNVLKPGKGAPGRSRNVVSMFEYSRWLFWWSAIATLTGGVTLAVVIAWFLRDAGWSWQAPLVEAWQKVSHSKSTSLPWIDSFRVPGYRIGDLRHNWMPELVGFSYVLIGAKYYQGLFSGLMPLLGRQRKWLGWHAIAAEACMRLEAVAAPIIVSVTVIVDGRLWPISTAIGQTIVVFVNLTVWSFAARSIREAANDRISTAGDPNTRIHGLDSFKEWIPSSLFYACVVWVIGSLIYVGVLHDVAVYAVAVASINIFLFYVVKCGIGGRDVRVGLARGCMAAERLRLKPPEATPSTKRVGKRSDVGSENAAVHFQEDYSASSPR
jgi:serine/threonine protein kinase